MPRSIYEGAKQNIEVKVTDRRTGGAVTLTSPERRILDSSRTLVTGFDWATASWDSDTSILSALFDSTQTGLTTAGLYYMQLRGTVGAERYEAEEQVTVKDWGP